MEREKLELLREELIRYRQIFLIDRLENFEHEKFLTTIDCHIEDLDILLDDTEDKSINN